MRYTVLKKKKKTLVDSIWGTIPELALWPPHEHTFMCAHTHACWHTRIPTNQITVIHLYELLLYQTLLDSSILYIKTLQIRKLRIWLLGQSKSNWTIELGSSKLRVTDVTPPVGMRALRGPEDMQHSPENLLVPSVASNRDRCFCFFFFSLTFWYLVLS